MQDDSNADSKLKTETESTSLKQDTEKSSLAFVSAVAVDGDAPILPRKRKASAEQLSKISARTLYPRKARMPKR